MLVINYLKSTNSAQNYKKKTELANKKYFILRI